PKVAEKIRISGGGRCNFTNLEVGPQHFLGENPDFCRSALARFTPQDFVALVRGRGIGFHEKHKGQLFCDRSAQDIIDLLLALCQEGAVQHWQPCPVERVSREGGHYRLHTGRGEVRAPRLVVATGGLSIPKIGASDWGYRIARQFGLRVVPTRPALVPRTFAPPAWAPYADLAGVALPVRVAIGGQGKRPRKQVFEEDLLMTHRGLSGPAALQISSFWREGQSVEIDLAPGQGQASDLSRHLIALKAGSRKQLSTELARLLPARLAEVWTGQRSELQKAMPDVPDKVLQGLAQSLKSWTVTPEGTEGYRKAEVTAGGIDTRDLSSHTLESRQSDLYFIGEVVDITGWLGGYNFQWAWASAHACARALPAGPLRL
ncbi:MAG: NAD(P)/FAD-dependent oxidoreductase, partial [Burkholderiaceae bacterium]